MLATVDIFVTVLVGCLSSSMIMIDWYDVVMSRDWGLVICHSPLHSYLGVSDISSALGFIDNLWSLKEGSEAKIRCVWDHLQSRMEWPEQCVLKDHAQHLQEYSFHHRLEKECTMWPSLSHPLKLSHFSEATGTFPTPQSWYCMSKMDSNLHLMLEATPNEDFPLINKVMIIRQAA